MSREIKAEKRWWAIHGNCGFYYDHCLTKKEAIKEHVEQTGIPWEACKQKGDTAVRVEIRPLKKETKP